MFWRSTSTSLSVRVIQREVTFPVRSYVSERLYKYRVTTELAGCSKNEQMTYSRLRAWAKMHGNKCVRQRNVRLDNEIDRAGTLPLNLSETDTVLKAINLNPLDRRRKTNQL